MRSCWTISSMEACGMSDGPAPNAGHSKPSLREMVRQAVANTADLKIIKCARGTTSIQENAGFAAIRAKRSKAVVDLLHRSSQ